MNLAKTPIVKRSLLSWALSGNFKLQTMLLVTIVVSVGVRVLPLEMQKRIVNHAIKLKDFELLFLYCGLYLAAVILSGVLKYGISYFQTVIGQQALKEMRIQLYRHMLMLPLGFFRRTQPGMVVQSFSTELATAGDFVGLAVGTPITSLLTLLAFGGYLFWLNPLLAIASFAIYPFVLIVLPMLQKRANTENKNRVDTSRDLSSKIAEAVTGIHEIQSNGAYDLNTQCYAPRYLPHQ